MINTLLTRIAGLLEREFLFASFLPGLLFATALGATMLAVVGGESGWAGLASYTTLQKGVFTVVGGMAVILFSYVLHILRSAFLDFWSGRIAALRWGLVRAAEQVRRGRYERLAARARAVPRWRSRFDAWTTQVAVVWNKDWPTLPAAEKAGLMELANSLKPGQDDAEVANVLDSVLAAYTQYSGEDLADVFELLKRQMEVSAGDEEARIQNDSYCLDREFGTRESVRATRLGNVIESYQQYPAKRYRIETEIFWPRLQKVITTEYMDLLREPRIVLDFSVTMASLAVAYCAFALLAGPWLWFNALLWVSLGAAAALAAFFFYQVAVRAALQLGELIRSSFDLFRLDLLQVLRLPEPANHAEEKQTWEKFSHLAVYGEGADFQIQPKA
jgi:hypothetical protein